MAQVVSLHQSVSVPYGTFQNVLETHEFSPLEPGVVEAKFYAANVGLLLTLDPIVGGDTEQLVAIKVDGTSHNDKLHGYAGGDQLNGNGGNDNLNGLAGRDTVHGGTGNDLLDGGSDKSADFLYGDSGNDKISVRAADHAFGGSGNDLINLFDNTGFGSIDGGSQQCKNLTHSHGDLLHFNGGLDLTTPGLSERIHGIESVSMKDGQGNDSLKLSAHDVLDLGTGTFDPHFCSHDTFGKGDALRIDGDSGDKCTLTGGNWSQINPNNAPVDYNVFACHTSTGNAYALVQEDVTVHLS
jgi:Ca2+-binding RTX toxin-like protein